MGMRTLFTDHPDSVGETYFQHLAHALWFSTRMIAGGMACLIHAVLPFMFVKTASRAIAELNDRMVLNRRRVLNRHEPTLPLGMARPNL